jgi:2-dehydro-3-deoxygalactonokinase
LRSAAASATCRCCSRGWSARISAGRPAPYVAAPAGITELAAGLLWIDDRTAIVPGISTLGGWPPDVMRGEEVQLLGAVAAGLVPADSLLAQPGTHCKWVEMRDGKVADFVTAMTGELFALLRKHGLLAAQLGSEVTLGDAFREGVEDGKRQDLAASLFGIRAAKMLGQRDDADAASYASGLLIGTDVAARLATSGTTPSTSSPIRRWAASIPRLFKPMAAMPNLIDSHAAFVAGINEIVKQ